MSRKKCRIPGKNQDFTSRANFVIRPKTRHFTHKGTVLVGIKFGIRHYNSAQKAVIVNLYNDHDRTTTHNNQKETRTKKRKNKPR